MLGEFTPAQWEHLKASFELDWKPTPCDANCESAARLGQALFFEPQLSGKGDFACTTCHEIANGAWLTDGRTENSVSASANGYTKHNTITLVDLALKDDLAPADRHYFTWTGECEGRPCDTPATVIVDIALPRAMASTPELVGELMRTSPIYGPLYTAAFGVPPAAPYGNDMIVANVARAFEAFMRKLVSLDSPFDRFLAGDDAAISDDAKRGFGIFVGRGLCAECHRGPLFTDYDFHVTGVAQSGNYAPLVDIGRGGTGAFYTGALRHIAETGPYMHDGSIATLAQVIDFYRWGGSASGYVGTKDPRIVPLEITDKDAYDLEIFLRTLTGAPIADELRVDPRPQLCGGSCQP